MTFWYVHRRADNSIASAHAEPLPDYATEALDDATNAEIQAWLSAVRNPTPPELKRAQIMRQLAAAGKLDAARAAVQGADALTQELWIADTWQLSTLQSEPYASMVAALGIELPTFWAAAAAQSS